MVAKENKQTRRDKLAKGLVFSLLVGVASLAQNPSFHNAPASAKTEKNPYQGQQTSPIHQAISSLHSKLRKVVLLRELNGCTTRETAKELGITISAAKARIHRARHDMRVQIERRHSAAHAAFLYR